jgi:hypothetical protein
MINSDKAAAAKAYDDSDEMLSGPSGADAADYNLYRSGEMASKSAINVYGGATDLSLLGLWDAKETAIIEDSDDEQVTDSTSLREKGTGCVNLAPRHGKV